MLDCDVEFATLGTPLKEVDASPKSTPFRCAGAAVAAAVSALPRATRSP